MDSVLASLKSAALCQSALAEGLSHGVSELRLHQKQPLKLYSVCSLGLFLSFLFLPQVINSLGSKS